MTHKKHPYVYRRYWQLFAAAIFFIVAVFILFVFLLPAFADTAPVDQHVILEWGQTVHVLCTQDAFDSQPNGITNIDVTGSDNLTITCRPPGTETK